VITMAPEYCPGASAAGLTDTESVAGVTPAEAVTLSQLPPEEVAVVIEKATAPPLDMMPVTAGPGDEEPYW
jgi:hypothetical protein